VRKITVEVPPELLAKALRASGSGITQTVREGRPMIAVDTSTWSAFLQGDGGEDAAWRCPDET
jgi:hypothetical protein